jgi:DNA-binding Lrp family transcriptional regulator
MDDIDIIILQMMRNGIPIVDQPFSEVSRKLGISQNEVIARLKNLIKEGVIRRFGISIDSQRLGESANALVAIKVPITCVEKIGEALSANPEVTHCFERRIIPRKWEYNLYLVIHGRDREACKKFIQNLLSTLGLNEYIMLFSIRQLKNINAGALIQNHGEIP